jgi:hypothetical protein
VKPSRSIPRANSNTEFYGKESPPRLNLDCVDVRIVRVVVFGREVGIHGRSHRRSGDAEENAVFLYCFP